MNIFRLENCLLRAFFYAVAAADTFWAVGIFPHFDVHLADPLALPAFGTGIFFYLIAVQCNWVKCTVGCSQRADIFAERSVEPDGKYNCYEKQNYFP